MMKKLFAFLLALVLIFAATGCGTPSQNLMQDVRPLDVTGEKIAVDGENAVGPTDFAVQLFQSTQGEGNTMVSPVSVLYALAMTANGARGETLAQMESVLGMDMTQLNTYLAAYRQALPESDKCRLHIANSLWLTEDERFSVEQDFLQTNATYYDADIYRAAFDDATCREINTWVEDNTDGMIRDILNEIPPDAVMYLINAMAFDAEWQAIYQENQVRDGVFTTESGETQDVEMMHSEEFGYLDDGNATGFVKYYAGGDYAFVALLPREGMSVGDYVATLTGEGLAALLAVPREEQVYVTLPKFESEYSTELSRVLQDMGMVDAFDVDKADLSGLGSSTDGNIFISRVLHKTFIAVDEKGTRAGAATVVEVDAGAAMIEEEPKEVILDRPFVYLIVDCQAKLPLFMGTTMSVK